jgi:hypothetical protein
MEVMFLVALILEVFELEKIANEKAKCLNLEVICSWILGFYMNDKVTERLANSQSPERLTIIFLLFFKQPLLYGLLPLTIPKGCSCMSIGILLYIQQHTHS